MSGSKWIMLLCTHVWLYMSTQDEYVGGAENAFQHLEEVPMLHVLDEDTSRHLPCLLNIWSICSSTVAMRCLLMGVSSA